MSTYTTKQAAKLLKLSQGSVGDLIRSGRLQASNIGKGRKNIWRIKETEIESFLNRRSTAVRTRSTSRTTCPETRYV